MTILSVCSLKGGVGKTSVVLGLASAAFIRGVSTLVVDLDPQGDATIGLDVEAAEGRTVADVLRGPKPRPVGRYVTAANWVPADPDLACSLDVIAGSPQAFDMESSRSGRIFTQLDQLLADADTYQLILLDCPPSFGTLTKSALAASHRAVVVTEPALFSVAAADRALRAIDELRRQAAPQLQPLGVLVNRYRERSPEHRYRLTELAELFGPLVLSPAIPERSVMQQAQGASLPIHQWPGPAAEEIAEVFDQQLSRILRASRRR